MTRLSSHTEHLAFPTALLAMFYIAFQIRKIWIDSRKGVLDAKKVELEIQCLKSELGNTNQDINPGCNESTENRPRTLKRQDLFVFLAIAYNFSMFIWYGASASSQWDLFITLLYAMALVAILQMFLVIVIVRSISILIATAHSSFATMLMHSLRIQMSLILPAANAGKSRQPTGANGSSDKPEEKQGSGSEFGDGAKEG